MNHPDLFCGESAIIKKEPTTILGEWTRLTNYRKAEEGAEKKCKNCTHHSHGQYQTKYLHKCRLLGMSHSEATDIRVHHVCDRWEEDSLPPKE